MDSILFKYDTHHDLVECYRGLQSPLRLNKKVTFSSMMEIAKSNHQNEKGHHGEVYPTCL